MAKNWKPSEAIEAIKAGNKEDMMDIGRRFPLFSMLAVQLNDAGVLLANSLPDYCTVRKLESVLKGDAVATNDDDSNEESEEVSEEKTAKQAKKGKTTKQAKSAKEESDDEETDEYTGKSAKELYNMCKKAGLKVKPKQDKEVYIEALRAAEEPADEDEGWEEDEEKTTKTSHKDKKSKPAKQAKADDDDEWDI